MNVRLGRRKGETVRDSALDSALRHTHFMPGIFNNLDFFWRTEGLTSE